MNKFTEYTNGRNDGLLLAKNIFEEGGMEALNKELKFRGATKIHTSLMVKELDKLTEDVKHICFETILIAMISVLHDEFGFGHTRCQRAVDGFMKLTDYLDNGWLYWMDLVESIQTEMGVKVATDYVNQINMCKHWAHPECDEIYEEPDLVDPLHWQAIMRKLKFSERKMKDSKDDGMEVLDDKGEPIFEYHGRFEKIGMYDILTGIQFAKEYWGLNQ